MNLLTDGLPTGITVDGGFYPIVTDYRAWLRFSMLMQSDKTGEEKTVGMLSMLKGKLPPRFEETISAILAFYTGGEPAEEQGTPRAETHASRIYDFAYDSGLIYAAFFQQYGIDLQRAEFHWWQFKALFNALSEDTQFMKVVGYRGMDLSKIKDKTQREFYSKMKKQYALPIPQSEKEQLSKIEQALLNGGDLTGLI